MNVDTWRQRLNCGAVGKLINDELEAAQDVRPPVVFRVMRNARAQAAPVADYSVQRQRIRPPRRRELLCYFLPSLEESRFDKFKFNESAESKQQTSAVYQQSPETFYFEVTA